MAAINNNEQAEAWIKQAIELFDDRYRAGEPGFAEPASWQDQRPTIPVPPAVWAFLRGTIFGLGVASGH